jgi:hypothetical protein
LRRWVRISCMAVFAMLSRLVRSGGGRGGWVRGRIRLRMISRKVNIIIRKVKMI